MTHTILNQSDIQKRIPHRFENALLDSCTILEPGNGKGDTLITQDDPSGRQLFTWSPTDDSHALLTPASMEIMALLSIATTGAVKEGENAFFAAISNFKRENGQLNTADRLNCHARRASDKGGFLMYKGTMDSAQGNARGDVMAFYTDMNTETDTQEAKKTDLPDMPLSDTIAPPKSKDSCMFLCDRIRAITDTNIITEYTYPNDHPLTRGHFPDRAIMMGIMQWMIAEDAAYAISVKKDLTGHQTIKGDATLIKDDGSIVCDMKRLSIEVWRNHNEHHDGASTLSAKRIAFKSVVVPGDTLILKLNFTIE
jgi:3-hydroxymyristoyl/3-hydroxydecanoyl-(acyl carrier protein) dehydratase